MYNLNSRRKKERCKRNVKSRMAKDSPKLMTDIKPQIQKV